MSREFYMAFCFSIAAHAVVVGVCPSPESKISGQSGEEQNIVVLGVIDFAPEEQRKPAILDIEREVKQSEHALETTPSEPADDPERLCEDQVVMVEPEEPPPSTKEQLQPEEPPEEEPPSHAEAMTPGKQVLSRGQIEDMRSQYLREVMQTLEKAKRYPPYAWRHGIEGTVKIQFTIQADGHASDIILHRSSRYRDLNTAAQDLIARASPFCPIPGELDQERMTISVPIAFQIKTP